MKIGFIGQGWIGKNYADNFEKRGFEVVRYSLEPKYKNNRDLIKDCEITFIAVPTPTTEKGFDYSFVESALNILGDGHMAVIKSTLVPNTTVYLQSKYPDIFIYHSPEFLSERSVLEDVENPHANVVGYAIDSEIHKEKAKKIISILPKSNFDLVCSALEAELIKYSRNIHGYFEILFYNMFYDFVSSYGADYDTVNEYIKNDPLHLSRYSTPFHASGHDLENPKRGAGGHCFIKDYKAFVKEFEQINGDDGHLQILKSLEQKNNELLIKSNKDLDILKNVYGEDFILKNNF